MSIAAATFQSRKRRSAARAQQNRLPRSSNQPRTSVRHLRSLRFFHSRRRQLLSTAFFETAPLLPALARQLDNAANQLAIVQAVRLGGEDELAVALEVAIGVHLNHVNLATVRDAQVD